MEELNFVIGVVDSSGRMEASMNKVNVGIVGCGNISGIYFSNCKNFSMLDIVACSDLNQERAEAKAKEFDVPVVCSTEELLKRDDIQIVINLTTPEAHADICMAAIDAGKSVYVEKPLTIELEDGRKLLETAKEKGLLVGSAPDTFLGAGLQTCRKLIDDGWIGKPVAATAFMMCHGHEGWHPDPEFYYKKGGGPMFDMGPYYLTALVSLLGPVQRVAGSTRITFPERTIMSEPKRGTKIEVEVPTHVAGVLDFENGAIGTIVTSFDVWGAQVPMIEIYGTKGSLSVPDPNTFGGPVRFNKPGMDGWSEIPLTHGFAENSRGIGVADMANALISGGKHRASGDLAYHVLELMHGFHISSDKGAHFDTEGKCAQPEPLSPDFTR